MTNAQMSPAVMSRGLKKEGNLVRVTRATILQILARFCKEVKMEDLDRSGQDGSAIAFDPQAKAGERFR